MTYRVSLVLVKYYASFIAEMYRTVGIIAAQATPPKGLPTKRVRFANQEIITTKRKRNCSTNKRMKARNHARWFASVSLQQCSRIPLRVSYLVHTFLYTV